MNDIPIRDESIVLKKEVEDDDPFEMVGVGFDGQSEAELRDMALCFAEEFIRDGWDETELFYLYKSPFYVGPYMAWKQKGDDFVKEVIAEAVSMWRPKKMLSSPNVSIGDPEKQVESLDSRLRGNDETL